MKWLGKWFPSDRAPRDQCDLRRRAIVVVVASPIAVAGAVVFGVLAAVLWLGFKLVAVIITAVLLFFGRRELDFSVIYQWNNLAMPDIWQFSRPSIWTSKKVSSVGYVNRPFWQQLLTPPMVAGFVVISMVARQSVTDGIFIGVSLVLALSLIAFLGARVVTKLKQAPKRTISVEQRSKQQRELALLTAGGSASLDDLPPEQRTVRLRFLDLKASVCKPFAK